MGVSDSHELLVHKNNAAGREVWAWPATRLGATATSVVVEARFNGPEGVVQGLRLSQGDRFVESYFADRWYNVFTVFDRHTGARKGWYCNVARPARLEDGHVYWDDLSLDLVVLPDGRQAILDRDEFEALGLEPAERLQALAALEELQQLATARDGPFAD